MLVFWGNVCLDMNFLSTLLHAEMPPRKINNCGVLFRLHSLARELSRQLWTSFSNDRSYIAEKNMSNLL